MEYSTEVVITNHTHDTELDVELVTKCRYYMQGIALPPISVFGMIGKLIWCTFIIKIYLLGLYASLT